MKTKAVCHLAPVASRSWRTWSSYTAAAEVRTHPTLICTAGGRSPSPSGLINARAHGREWQAISVECQVWTDHGGRGAGLFFFFFFSRLGPWLSQRVSCSRLPAPTSRSAAGWAHSSSHLEHQYHRVVRRPTNPTGQLRMFPSSYPMITPYPNLSEYSCRSAELSCAPMIPVGALPRMISHSLYDRPHALVSQTSAKFPSPVIRAARFCRNQLGNARPAPACRRLRAPARTTTNRPGQVHCCAASLRPHACMFPNSDPMITASGYAGAFLSQRWAPTIPVGACHDFPLIASVRDRQTIAPSRPTKITAAFRHVLSTSLLRSINLFSHMYYRFF